MKKFILPILLFLMFMPFIVNAETCDTDKITIENITIETKSNNVEEIEEATASGKNISLNLSMSEIGDNIEYKFVVKNNSNKDYELDKTSLNLNSDYINYSFETDDNSNIVKANSSKNVTLRVEYKKEVPEDKFENGSYNDNRNVTIQLSNSETINVPNNLKNPNTGVQSYTIILLITLFISGSLYILLKKKKFTKYMVLIIGIAIIVPMSVYAVCKISLKIDSNVKIVEEKTFYSVQMGGACPSEQEGYYDFKIGDRVNYYKYFIKEGNSIIHNHFGYDSLEECENERSEVAINMNKNPSDLICEKDFFRRAYHYCETEEDIPTMLNKEVSSFIRYKLRNGVITNSDLGFVANNKIYYLIGGNSSENAQKNLELVKSIYGDNACYEVDRLYYKDAKGYRCHNNNVNWAGLGEVDMGISENNDIEFTNDRYILTHYIYSSGVSGMGYCT